MLTKWDDYFVHQMGETLSVVENDDPRWFDRAYFGIYDREGRFFLVTGIGTYPNAGDAGVMDGYACVVHNGLQHNLRLSRQVRADRAHTHIGALGFHVREPMETWSLELEPNDFGISFSLEYEARVAPFLVKKIVFPKPEGQPTTFSHYIQPGRYRGTVEIGGTRFHSEGDDYFLGCRDRSWGLRAARERQGLHLWIQVHFSNFCLSLFHDEARDGTITYSDGAVLYDSGEVVSITEVRHRMEFAEGTVEHTGGEVLLQDARGHTFHLQARRLSPGIYMAGGGYGGWHGIDRGELHIEGEQWDLNDPNLINMIPYSLYDQLARFELNGESAVGIFEAGFSRSPAYRYQPRW